MPHTVAPSASCYAPRMKVATLPHRHEHFTDFLPDGEFWDDETGHIVQDEDGSLMELA